MSRRSSVHKVPKNHKIFQLFFIQKQFCLQFSTCPLPFRQLILLEFFQILMFSRLILKEKFVKLLTFLEKFNRFFLNFFVSFLNVFTSF